jgi:hypothetical protein
LKEKKEERKSEEWAVEVEEGWKRGGGLPLKLWWGLLVVTCRFFTFWMAQRIRSLAGGGLVGAW